MSGFYSVTSVLTGFVIPTRMLTFWKSAGWVFHLSVFMCSSDSILFCKYRELLCRSILLTFLIALYSVLLHLLWNHSCAAWLPPWMIQFWTLLLASTLFPQILLSVWVQNYFLCFQVYSLTWQRSACQPYVSTAPNCTCAFSLNRWDSCCSQYTKVELLHK